MQIWDNALSGPKATAPYLTHHFRRGQIVSDFGFCPYDDALGVGHSGGFSNLMVPGSGEPNYDPMVANPFETKGQRREMEVAKLLDKLPPEMIQLDGEAVGKVRAMPKEVQKERREAAVAAELASRKAQRDKNAEKSRMKGKNRISKRYRKKQQNVVDDKKLRAKLKADEAKMKAERARAAGGVGGRVGGDGPEGAGRCRRKPRARGRTHRTLRMEPQPRSEGFTNEDEEHRRSERNSSRESLDTTTTRIDSPRQSSPRRGSVRSVDPEGHAYAASSKGDGVRSRPL